ncbi:hypothetical protein BDV96DRAFT_598430 [Lophiotrema nucula]|uniref:Uncharacterized protein n=1 Tax=Lophiotrema nucula TaxID=690887 RepID=A0A6A5ZDL5_9PLEO|nr:hypothetical protein BDV96DRAFT_598430 [Lophiotrema nucula]
MYKANDMRLFHHFLIAAHPCIPQEHEAVWIRDVPAYSHQYDYLMHSILALSGSHLGLFINSPDGCMALSHRQKAIKGLENAFSRWPPEDDEVHIMLATSYLLGFQSAYMPDGLVDHILSFRGCSLLSKFILDNQVSGWFNVDPNMHTMWLELRLRNFPALDQGLARDGLQSLAEFAPLLSRPPAREIDRTVFAQLVECIRPLLTPVDQLDPSNSPSTTPAESQQRISNASSTSNSPPPLFPHINNPILPGEVAASFDGLMSNEMELITQVPPEHKPQPLRAFNALMSSLLVLTTYPQDQVLDFLSLSDNISNIVLAHFVAVRFIVAPLFAPQAAMRTPIEAMVEWCEYITQAVEDDEEVKWTRYVEWPRRILATMRCCLDQKRGLTFGDLYNILTKDPAAFREGRMSRL